VEQWITKANTPPPQQMHLPAQQAVKVHMYPNADENFLSEKLGDNPDLEKVRSVAEDIAMHGHPKEDESKSNGAKSNKHNDVEETKPKSKVLGSKKLGKAFSGLKASKFGGLPNMLKQHATGDGMMNTGNSSGGMSAPPNGQSGVVPPESDASLQSNMEQMLSAKVRQSPSIDERGLQSQERTTSIPEVSKLVVWPCRRYFPIKIDFFVGRHF
jgi:hypothetical protein